jgi:hypothetical protein
MKMTAEEEYQRCLVKAAMRNGAYLRPDLADFFMIGIRERNTPKCRGSVMTGLLARLLLLVIRTDTGATVGHLVPALVTVVVPAAGGGRSTSTGV